MDEMEGGDCFPTAYVVAQELDADGFENVRIVHGIPTGRGGEVRDHRFWHAWVEYDEVVQFPNVPETRITMVVDRSNGLDVEFPAGVYHNIGQVEEMWRFTVDEAEAEMDARGHYGPWVDGWEERVDVL